MKDFSLGQRWISTSEPDLGLGIVLHADERVVEIAFPQSDTLRRYNRQQAPLDRVRFAPGDEVLDSEGTPYEVEAVLEEGGLFYYRVKGTDGTPHALCESRLHGRARLNTPLTRLLSGQLDASSWFTLRRQTLEHQAFLAAADLRGLAGGRIGLIPHQLYIAREVARRHAPRVLLADEVGLGKTIEAGMVLHQQLLSQQAQRVMILVPEHLLHQWLVEMLRRFNLAFTLLDEARCQDTESAGLADNPFEAQQLVLCSLDWLSAHPQRQEQAAAAAWDLLVIDEAHHLAWSPSQASAEYQLAERLAARTRGLLLLSATPEQLGMESHFARLRLLDPERFSDYGRFVEEQQHYAETAQLAQALLSDRPLTEETRNALLRHLPEVSGALDREPPPPPLRQQWVQMLVDRHGTGRVLFRNTRQRVGGFPQRQINLCPLSPPTGYSPTLLYPERDWPDDEAAWWRSDPRIDWLWSLLRKLRGEKVLLICAHDDTALELAEGLRVRFGLQAALFHSGLSLVACDRAAAFFAEDEGTPLLISSEIGSEGRNFQFASHLVLFDLPLNPDRLEQRIGRLDRIGQGETITLHLPYFTETAQALLLDWYHRGLDALQHPCPTGQRLFEHYRDRLEQLLQNCPLPAAQHDSLIDTTRQQRDLYERELQAGRDQLLEMNSCNPQQANALVAAIQTYEQERTLRPYLEALFDGYGVDHEEHSPHCLIARPGNHQLVSHFPALPEDGCTLTFDRDTALSREEMQFITWEHPMVTGAMELLVEDGQGKAVVSAVKHPAFKRGELLLEALYTLECPAPASLQLQRFLPPACLRVLVNNRGEALQEELPGHSLDSGLVELQKPMAQALIQGKREEIERLAALAQDAAQPLLEHQVAQAANHMVQELCAERDRLLALREHNPSVRQAEIDHLQWRLDNGQALLADTRLRLEGLRLLLAL